MFSSDLLGELGRRALDSCVQIIILGKVGYGKSSLVNALKKKRDEQEMNFVPKVGKKDEKDTSTYSDRQESRWTSVYCDSTEEKRSGCNANERLKATSKHREKATSRQIEEMKQLVTEPETDIDSKIVHGSGFIVHNNFVITNKHVIGLALNDQTERYKVYISNAKFAMLPCNVFDVDEFNDLAILYCQHLNLEQNGIRPLLLSNQPLLPEMTIFCFGYPVSYRGERALFVNGTVCAKETSSDDPMVPLKCSLNSGNNGSPVLCWISGQLKVVGVVTQKNFQETCMLDGRNGIKNIQGSSQVCPHVQHDETSSLIPSGITSKYLVIRKVLDALKARSQFGALPGIYVVEFIKTSASKQEGKYKEELSEIVNQSQILK